MYSKINIILALFILGGCSWVIYSFREPHQKITPEVINTSVPNTTDNVTVSDDTTGKATVDPVIPTKDTPIVSQEVIIPQTQNPTPVAGSKPTSYMTLGKVIHYQNRDFGYSFDLPNNLYYSGFGAQAGAKHTVGIQSATSPDTLATSTTRVYFFGKKLLSEVSPTVPLYQDPAGKYLVILIDGTYSFKIESEDIRSEIVQTIVQTLKIQE